MLRLLNEPGQFNSSLEALCLTCGMCCNGVIFADVKLHDDEAPDPFRRLGLPIRQRRKPGGNPHAPFFRQPCAAFAGCRCRIYPDRPGYCREFECVLLRSVRAGQTDPAAALQVIRTARERADKVRRLLRELGDADERLALAARFRRTAKRLETGGLSEETADIFGRLTLAVHDLNLLLSEAFYPGEIRSAGNEK